MIEKKKSQTYLRDTIRVSDVSGPAPTYRCMVMKHEELFETTDLLNFDKEGIKALCDSARNPVGTIDDPNNPNHRVTKPGQKSPAICEKRLHAAI